MQHPQIWRGCIPRVRLARPWPDRFDRGPTNPTWPERATRPWPNMPGRGPSLLFEICLHRTRGGRPVGKSGRRHARPVLRITALPPSGGPYLARCISACLIPQYHNIGTSKKLVVIQSIFFTLKQIRLNYVAVLRFLILCRKVSPRSEDITVQ